MRIVILTQEDAFFIPKNIDKVAKVYEVIEVVNIDSKGSLNNKFRNFLKWFGFFQVFKLGLRILKKKIENTIDKLFCYKLMHGFGSVKAAAYKNKIPYQTIKNVNDNAFFNHIQEMKPDLIISYSAPQVIKDPLLSYPKYGTINVHGSYLPDYRGLLPSFWHLYNKEEFAGATVHYMSKEIDDGLIILQGKISVKECTSMFEVMELTKELGGGLMLNAIEQIKNNTINVKPNNSSDGRYFTWPTTEQAKVFRQNKNSLI